MKKGFYPNSYIFSDVKGIEHILIAGDNKEKLPLLQTEYKDKIDLIYLDPPYNTKNGEGYSYKDKREKWIDFMKERLILSKPLLSETGFIFISINEDEFANLKFLCDEIFGAKNFVSYLIWKKKGAGGIPKCGSLIVQTEFILIFAKNRAKARLNKIQKVDQNVLWRDFRKSGGAWQKKYRPKQCFPIYYNPISQTISLSFTQKSMIKILPIDSNGVLSFWMNSIQTTNIKIQKGLLKVVKNNVGKYKVYCRSDDSNVSSIGNLIDIPSIQGTKEIQALGLKFNNPKPLSLMIHLLSIGSKPNSIILDFFAGSGTTGCAVLNLNYKSSSQRKFILIQNNENGIFKKVCLPRIKKILSSITNDS